MKGIVLAGGGNSPLSYYQGISSYQAHIYFTTAGWDQRYYRLLWIHDCLGPEQFGMFRQRNAMLNSRHS